ncbi:flavin monoamine oxidase family protein [Paucibacter sp. KCTC 42545]|uniref:flavin monoamine oxidase family protein n=1 Tax=Paucibacter sp. KCTC 42545 TaxID=1768242 RepID=UPI0012E33492|nr:FAD-dependent oxidoreductase [Paucibacter sp. KCTC 42545]
MGQGALKRRSLILGAGTALLGACQAPSPEVAGGWVGASAARGHRLRTALPDFTAAPVKRCQTLIIGGGVSGLACARALVSTRHDDVVLLELEDRAGGNSRGHQMGGMACPLGAHYLPVPGRDSPEVYQLLEELGLVRQVLGRPVYEERHLCHSPQERLFFQGQWHEGLLPPALTPGTREQYQRFEAAVDAVQRQLRFTIPSHRAGWTPKHAELDGQTFATWLRSQGLDDAQLLWYLDYCCRDDFGAGLATVSAWAGLHYFASRHGFHPPGDSAQEREPVLTWPQGNSYLTEAMSAGLQAQLHSGRTVLRISPDKHQVQVQAWNEATQSPEVWEARQVVLATPLFIANRLLAGALAPLRAAAQVSRYAPWLVANLHIGAPLLQRVGAPPSWDNVVYGGQALGYVDAMHQSLSPQSGATVLTAYWALPQARRAELLQADWRPWLGLVLAELSHVHPDLPGQLLRADLMRWGHAMSIPVPGLRGASSLAALRRPQGRLHFAHSDLAGYSVFEEAYTRGVEVAAMIAGKHR